MLNNPRLAIAREYLGLEHRYAETMLARQDAVDPMRREPSEEAVEAAIRELFGVPSDELAPLCAQTVRAALTAALAVMAEGSVAAAEPPADPKPEWTAEQRNALIVTMQVVQKLARHVGRSVLADEIDYVRLAAFARPEPVWPPSGCVRMPGCKSICDFPAFCPHAGERCDR